MAEIEGIWLQSPTTDAPDVVAERYECPTCGAICGPLSNRGVASVSLVTRCCGLTIELVPATCSDGHEDGMA